ncbi:unnamed protein product [Parnassius apollo]|uniref:(apollo) hypothetical protein n=1 Tax=Parnassius apollo TaxID=110799 RepID=A0A8S3WHK7_PARAO|nr:unnamed protein product [Parnassius apollo]
MIKFEEKFDNQMQIWNKIISDCIANSIATAVNTALKGELSSSELNDNVLKLNMDTINLNKLLHEVNTRLYKIEKSLSFSNGRQDLFDSRVKTVEQSISQYNGFKTQIQLLENKIHTMEQQARQCNVERANIPDRRGENLISIMECLGDAIKHPLQSSEIKAVHRVPHADKNDRRPKNVKVRKQDTARQCDCRYKRVKFHTIVHIPNSVHYDGTEADSPESICNLFSSFFHSVFQPTNVSHSFCIDHIDDIDNGMFNNTIISDIQLSEADVLKELKAFGQALITFPLFSLKILP